MTEIPGRARNQIKSKKDLPDYATDASREEAGASNAEDSRLSL